MSLYSLNPEKFSESDTQMRDQEQRKEWVLLHGDGVAARTVEVEVRQQNNSNLEHYFLDNESKT
jgi:hypothetical protein